MKEEYSTSGGQYVDIANSAMPYPLLAYKFSDLENISCPKIGHSEWYIIKKYFLKDFSVQCHSLLYSFGALYLIIVKIKELFQAHSVQEKIIPETGNASTDIHSW